MPSAPEVLRYPNLRENRLLDPRLLFPCPFPLVSAPHFSVPAALLLDRP